MSGVGPAHPRVDLWADADRRLTERLDAVLRDRLRRTESRPKDGAGWVDISGHDLSTPCPSRWSVPFDDFVVSVPTAAGALARLALRDRLDAEPVGAAVQRVASGLGELDRTAAWFAEWYDQELDRAGRAALRSAATTWAFGALAAVDGRPLQWATSRSNYDVPGRTVRLRPTWDATTSGARPEVLVIMSARSSADPELERLAGFNALADGLHRKQVPLRVRIASAATASNVAFPVTADLLDAAIDRIVELVGWRVDRDGAPTAPGRWCRDCHLLDACPDARVP